MRALLLSALGALSVQCRSGQYPPGASAPAERVELLPTPGGPRAFAPSIARGADGSVWLSWLEREGEAEGADRGALYLSRLSAAGWDSPRVAARSGPWFLNWADFPSVAVLADGTLLTCWLRRSGEATYAYEVAFALSRDGGETFTEPRVLHEDRSPVEHGFVAFAPLDAERFGALWLDGRAMAEDGRGATALFFRTVSDRGALGPERRLDARVCDCCSTALLRTGGGELVAAYRDRSEHEVRDISLVRVAAGTEVEDWSAPRTIHDDGWEIDGCPVNGPRLAERDGTLGAVWFTGVGAGGGSVLAAFAGQDGEGFEAPLDVDDGLPEGRVDAALLADGTLVVAWLEHVEGRGEWRLRTVRRDGTLGASVTLDVVPSERSSGQLRLIADGTGVLAAWRAFEPEPGLATARVAGGGWPARTEREVTSR